MGADTLLKELGGPLMEAALIGVVREAIKVIRKERTRQVVKANPKLGYSGEMDDVFTSADIGAQEVYARILRELFPDYGIIAEESGLYIKCSPSLDEDVYFTIDPLDGTKAFIRSQPYGIGTMISLVRGNDVVATCIGDVLTQDIYSQPPEDNCAWRIDMEDQRQPLQPEIIRPLSKQFALVRGFAKDYSTLLERMFELPANGGLCQSAQPAHGSIGLSMARLWSGEFGLALQPDADETPWDATPIIGINKRLDILQLQQSESGYFISVPYQLTKVVGRQRETIYVHRHHLEELMRWQHNILERNR